MNLDTFYKYVIPVGDNCEIAAHLVRNGYKYSSLFRYARTELNLIENVILNDFDRVFEDIKVFNKTFVKDARYGVMWHSEIPSGDFDELYSKEYKKIKHLVDNTRDAILGMDEVLFIYKSNVGKFEYVESFCNSIIKYRGNDKFKLLVVLDEAQDFTASHRNILIENVSYHAPYDRAIKGGDNDKWNNIIKKYIME